MIQMKPPKNPKFYLEMVVATVLSLLAASLWTRWTEDFIRTYFDNSPSALLGFAIGITLLAVLLLQFLFSADEPRKTHHPSEKILPLSHMHP